MPETLAEWLRLYDAALAELRQQHIGSATLAWGEATHRLTPEQRIAAWYADHCRSRPLTSPPTPRQQRRWALCRCSICLPATVLTFAKERL